MYKDKRILAIIPARGGSKGILRKNIIDFCGKPLIAYSIDAAKNSKYIDYVLVSTDDKEIQQVSLKYGAEVPFLRPKEISNDTAKSIDVVLHATEFLDGQGKNFHYTILLQPTSPLRTAEDIDRSIEKLIESEGESLISLCEVDENPALMRSIGNNKLEPIIEFKKSDIRRQKLPKFYIINGAIYINSADMIKGEKSFVNDKTLPFIMERNRSIDIDNMVDLKLAELILKEKIND